MKNETNLDRWVRWLKRISVDVSHEMQERRLWREFRAMWRANLGLHVPGEAFPWIRTMYLETATIAVRRQMDPDPKCISLRRLLDQLEESSHELTREWFCARIPTDTPQSLRDRYAARFDVYAGSGGRHVRAAVPSRDRDRLGRIGVKVKRFVDRAVAHVDQRGEPALTWGQLENALRALERLALKYLHLFGLPAPSFETFEARRQFNEETVWRRPWMAPCWRPLSWPAGRVGRTGELWPTLDYLAERDVRRLQRGKRSLIAELRRSYKWPDGAPSPLRTLLTAHGLPACDAAVQWVKDQLVREGEIWTKEPPESS